MTYSEVESFLFQQLPMYQRQGVSAFKKNLNNIIALCDLLGNPEKKFKSIHIAGTNGKGSVSHIIAAGLQANGYRVGLYTSPHYKDYRERIKINAELISKEAVISFVTKHKEDFLRIQPSFFEITVAMAFQYFAIQDVDIAIIETGLGGRLDSTNILSPELSIITNISMDHQSMLGDTLVQIAGEKAGIIKKDTPIIIGEYQEGINHVFVEKAKSTGSLLYQADQLSYIQVDGEKFIYEEKESKWQVCFRSSMTHAFQQKNFVTALHALYLLKDKFTIDTEKIGQGIENMTHLTYYIGRWMRVQERPRVYLDSAHNEAGVRNLVKEIKNLNYQKLHIVWGTAADKDLSTILSLLPQDATYYFAKADIPRGMDAIMLRNMANDMGLQGYEYPSVPAAYRNALAHANAYDLVIVAGSIFVVAEIV